MENLLPLHIKVIRIPQSFGEGPCMWAAGVGSLHFLGRSELRILLYVRSASHRAPGFGIHWQPQDRKQLLDSASGSGNTLIVQSDLSSLPSRFNGASSKYHILAEQGSLYPVRLWDLRWVPQNPVTMEVGIPNGGRC